MSCFNCAPLSARKGQLRHFSKEELDSATSGFSPSSLLGRGSHGSVYLAALDNGGLLAAAKVSVPPRLQDSCSISPSSFTANEIAILSSLPHSPFLVNLLGLSITACPIAVVEFMPNGSLHDLLHHPFHNHPPSFPLRLRLALGVANAIATLHSLHPIVIHRDIKPSNILIDASARPRLADFGLAVRGLPSAAAPAGTIGYIDPAYVSPGDLSLKTDVYSFGIVLLELISGRTAIDVRHSPASIVKWAEGLISEGRNDDLWDPRGGRPASKEEAAVARDMALVALRCVDSSPQRRPQIKEVVACLRLAKRRAGFFPKGKKRWGKQVKVVDFSLV